MVHDKAHINFDFFFVHRLQFDFNIDVIDHMRNRSPEFQKYFVKIIVPHGINDSSNDKIRFVCSRHKNKKILILHVYIHVLV